MLLLPRPMFSDRPTAGSDGGSYRGRRLPLRLDAGQTLGRYEIVRELGAGTGGTVFEARDPELDRPVALKVLSVEGRGAERRAARLLREGRALARLTHPNVVTVLDVGRQGSLLWVAMERVDGVTLTRHLAEHRPDPRRTVELFVDAGRGLAEAHRVGLVHRDFKPDNVMVDVTGRVVVMDFGLSRARFDSAHTGVEAVVTAVPLLEGAADADGRLTRDGAILGTPFYMAPEQHLGQTASVAADQFSFCVALYEALFGHYPFAGDKVSSYAIEVVAGRVRTPTLGPVPRRVWSTIERGLCPQPEDRWPSMDHLLQHLGSRRGTGRLVLPSLLCAGVLGAWGMGWFDGPVTFASASDETAGCPADITSLRASWEERGRSDLERVVRRQGGPAALSRAGRFIGDFDRVARDVCDERATPKEVSCLRHAAIGFRGLLQASTLRDEVVRRWWWSVEQLPDPRRCSGITTTTLHWPEEQDISKRVDAQAQLVVAGALAQEWKHTEAQEIAAEQARWGERHGAHEHELEALELVGTTKAELGDLPGAIETWSGVYDRAEQLGLDEIAASAALQIADRELYRRDASEGEHWIRNAQSRLALIDRPDLRATTISEQARLHQLRGDLDQAIAVAQQATHVGDLAASHPLEHGALRANEAQILASAGKIDAAATIIDEVLRTREQLVGFDDPSLASLLINRAVMQRSRGQIDEASDDLERAIDLLRTAGRRIHPHTATALLNRGVIAADRGDIEGAIGHLEESLSVHEELYGPEHARVGLISVNLGGLEMERGNFDVASRHIERGLALYESNLSRNHHEFGQALVAKATLLQRQGRNGEAHAAYQRVVDQIDTPMWHLNAMLGMADTSPSATERKAHLQAALSHEKFDTIFGGERARVLLGLAELERDPVRAIELARRAQKAAASEPSARVEPVAEAIEAFLEERIPAP